LKLNLVWWNPRYWNCYDRTAALSLSHELHSRIFLRGSERTILQGTEKDVDERRWSRLRKKRSKANRIKRGLKLKKEVLGWKVEGEEKKRKIKNRRSRRKERNVCRRRERRE
jgi:hypothetical protein